MNKRIPIGEAIEFLDKHFEKIPSVQIWANMMGYSYSYFWRKFVICFEVSPQMVFIKKKKLVLLSFFKKNNPCNYSEAAKLIHHADGNSLYQFVKQEFGCTPTELQKSQNDYGSGLGE